MNILHAIATVNPEAGGPVEVVKQLARLDLIKGHSVSVASLDPPDAAYLKTFPARVIPLGPSVSKYSFNSRIVPWLRENVAQYDIVIVNGIWQYQSFAVWRVLHASHIPYVVFTHGMLDPWFKQKYPIKHLKKWLYWPWGEYRVLRDARAVLFTSEEEKLAARKSFWLYSARERVVAYGTSPPVGDEEAHKREFLQKFPELSNKRLAVFLGRIHPKKGCDLIIQAFAKVLAQDPDWHLVMAGPDQEGWKAALVASAEELHIADRITWTGMVAGNLKWGLLRSSEVMFLPSHQENFGVVVAEALACSLPVLISNRVNIWREVKADGCGLVDEDTLEGATALLRAWLNLDAKARAEMRRHACESFATRFSIELASDSLISTLEEVIEQHRQRVPHSSPAVQ